MRSGVRALVRTFGERCYSVARQSRKRRGRPRRGQAGSQRVRASAHSRAGELSTGFTHRGEHGAHAPEIAARKPEESIDALLPAFKADGHFAERFSSDKSFAADRLLERKETRRIVRAAIEELPDAYRTVLILRDIEEMSTKEVADALGMTTSAVKVRLPGASGAVYPDEATLRSAGCNP